MKDLIIIIPTLFNRQDLLKDCVSHITECINNTLLNVSLKVVINEKTIEKQRQTNVNYNKLFTEKENKGYTVK